MTDVKASAVFTGRKPIRGIQKMPYLRDQEEFEVVLKKLTDEWGYACMRLKEFSSLFDGGKAFPLLCTITGEDFLYEYWIMWWDTILLQICRLTDRLGTGGHKNLTVKIIPRYFCDNSALKKRINECIEEICDASQFARDWRNKRIAHADFNSVINPNSKTLENATLEKVRAPLDLIHKLLNCLSKRLYNTELVRPSQVISGRSGRFVSRVRALSEALQYIDLLIDPAGQTRYIDTRAARQFLQNLGLKPTRDQVDQIIKLRKIAKEFSKGATGNSLSPDDTSQA